jgi:rfaE bifunctional protein nucleotidyltransferase chain/domain
MSKVLSAKKLSVIVSSVRQAGRTVGICHGCFDIVHLGHIHHFKQAKRLVDVLIVSVTSDKFVNKGPDRPIFSAENRASFIAAIEYCDYVVINDSGTAEEIIKMLRPDKYFKGADYTASKDPRLNAEKHMAHLYDCELYLTDDYVMDSTSRIVRTLYEITACSDG